jgi:sarcosine oxidase subunit delta
MLLIACPWCGSRPELEFTYAGEAHVARAPDPSVLADEDVAELLYLRSNPRGWHVERWRHINGCGRFFNAQRHTVTDRFAATYKPGDPRPVLPETDVKP